MAEKKQDYGAGSITILEGLEADRKRPRMYIGSLSTKGLNQLKYEIAETRWISILPVTVILYGLHLIMMGRL